jgi:hypothetical protein
VRQLLRSPEFKRGRSGTPVGHGGVPTYVAYTGGSGIAARSGTTPGSATVTLYTLSGGTLATATTTDTAYNLSTSAVAASAYVVCMREQISGKLICVWEDCT